MARDGLFFSSFSAVSHGTRVPVWSIAVQALWSSVLAISGSYDQLTDYVIFASWIFYGMTTSAVFVLRRTMPDAARPYKTLGYPLIPVAFLLVATWLVFNTLIKRPIESAVGLVLILLGLPVFLYYRFRKKRSG
jgi:APA family basic amino acid/polyamine antiporter